MEFCKKDLSPYQRQSLREIDIMLGVAVAVNILLQAILYKHHPGLGVRLGMAMLSVATIAVGVRLVARYLRGERDDYLRTLVVESLLWGLVVTLLSDAFFSFVDVPPTVISLAGSLSLDIFLFTASLVLKVKLRSCR